MNRLIKKVLKKLNNKGFEAYIIGGYVRDYLLGISSNDYDICTSAKPDDLEKIFKDKIISNRYGSLKVEINNVIFEITTFRKESNYLNNRVPSNVEFVDDLASDLKRRDFTINTICMDINGNIIDVLNGREDLKNKIIKVVGDIDKKISEDALRILRAIRFATILNFKLDESLCDSIKKYGYLVRKLSYQRKRQELDLILSSLHVQYGLDLIRELKLDIFLDIDLSSVKITSLIGIWAQIDYKDVYPFSRTECEMIRKIRKLCKLNLLDDNNLYHYGLELLIICGRIRNIDEEIIIKKFNCLPIKNIKDIKLGKKELYNLLDKNEMININKIFQDLECKIVNKKLNNNREELLKYIQETYL